MCVVLPQSSQRTTSVHCVRLSSQYGWQNWQCTLWDYDYKCWICWTTTCILHWRTIPIATGCDWRTASKHLRMQFLKQIKRQQLLLFDIHLVLFGVFAWAQALFYNRLKLMFSPTYIKSARNVQAHSRNISKDCKSNKLQVDYYFGRSEPIMRIKKITAESLSVLCRVNLRLWWWAKWEQQKRNEPYRIKVRKAKSADFKFEFELYNTKTLQFAKLINKVN